jgi:hypothetical protein
MKPAASALPFALVLLAAPGVRAAERDAAAAEALFRDARRMADAGDYAGACPKFAESQRLDPAAGTLFNLADCEAHTGHIASAWEHFAAVVEQLPPADRRRAYAAGQVTTLEKKLPRLTIDLAPGSPADVRVERDGVELGAASLGTALPVDPGRHLVVVRASGRVERTFEVTMEPSDAQRLVVAAGDAGSAPAAPAPAAEAASAEPVPPPPDRNADAGQSRRTTGIVVGSAGIAALAVGTYFGVRALSRRSDSDAVCSAGICRDTSGISAYDDSRTYARVADVAFVVGVAAAAAGAYLILTSRAQVVAGVDPRGGAAVLARMAW